MSDESTTLEVRLNARLPSVQRGDRYEDPLAYWLEDRFPGSRVTGGGTLRSREGEPLVCGIDAAVVGDADTIEDAVVEYLEALGAPRGSTVALAGRAPRELGTVEGVALYLDRHRLPEEVYAENDVNEFLDALNDAVDGSGVLQAFWEGPEWTAVYVYGPSAEAISDSMLDLVAAHPLAHGARLERIA
ncbi:MAG TPA: hypothetical protein VFL59_15320 [Candidatus Nanopelagicales bacterium]|nr:hypothetical protein [Candidatus Nanopelagicales bacterium]